MSKIFLSHSHTDKPFVRQLAADLRNNGHTVWIDEAEIKIGDSLINKIREGLDAVDYVAVVLSKASVESVWVQRELEIASSRELREKRVLVLPLVLESVPLPGFLEGKFYADFSDPSKYHGILKRLLDSLGDSHPVTKSQEEVEQILKELEEIKKVASSYKQELSQITDYNLSTKSKELQGKIQEENANHPDYGPINNVYAFEIGNISVTLGYLLWSIEKSRIQGAHPLPVLITLHDKWEQVDRMLDAYSDMINSQKDDLEGSDH